MAARWLCLLGVLAWAGPARAETRNIPCGLVEAGSIHIDGLLSDWEGVAPVEIPGDRPGGARPLVLRVRCNYDNQAIYLLVDVDDDIMARTRAAGMGEDHVELGFLSPWKGQSIDRLLLWPGVASEKLPRRARWQSGRPLRLIDGEGPAGRDKPLKGPPAFEVYDALQQHGYAVEMRLPYKLLPGYKAGTPLPLGVRVVDGDSRAKPEPVSVAETSPLDSADDLSRVLFEEGQSALAGLLGDLKMEQGDIWWEKSGNIGAGPGRILAVGGYLAVVGKEYAYQELAADRTNIKELQLLDLGDRPGDGRQAVAVRTVERADSGSRELLRIFRFDERPTGGGLFRVMFAAEVAKQQGNNRLLTQVSYVRRGKLLDLVLVAGPAVGFTADSYSESPAGDVLPILLPWQDKHARYALKNGSYVRTDRPAKAE